MHPNILDISSLIHAVSESSHLPKGNQSVCESYRLFALIVFFFKFKVIFLSQTHHVGPFMGNFLETLTQSPNEHAILERDNPLAIAYTL